MNILEFKKPRASKTIYMIDPYTGLVNETTTKKLAGYLGVENLSKTNIKAQVDGGKIHPKLNVFLSYDKPTASVIRRILADFIIEDEVFKQYKDTSYYVSQYGRVRRYITESRSYRKKYDYMYIVPTLKKGVGRAYAVAQLPAPGKKGKSIQVRIARMVAELFVENDNPIENTHVCHKDGNALKYHHSNLVWRTAKEARLSGVNNNTTPVLKVCPETLEIIEEYPSASVAGKENFLTRSSINKCVNGTTRQAGGWMWVEDPEGIYASTYTKRRGRGK